jgi:hypothetical protein
VPAPAASDAGKHAQLLDLLGQMLAFQPHRRITVDAALAHPFLAECGGGPHAPSGPPTPVSFLFEQHNGGSLGAAAIKQLMWNVICGSRARAAPAVAPAPVRALPAPRASRGAPAGGTPGGSSGSGRAGAGSSAAAHKGAGSDAGEDGTTAARAGAAGGGGGGGGGGARRGPSGGSAEWGSAAPAPARAGLFSWRGLFGQGGE